MSFLHVLQASTAFFVPHQHPHPSAVFLSPPCNLVPHQVSPSLSITSFLPDVLVLSQHPRSSQLSRILTPLKHPPHAPQCPHPSSAHLSQLFLSPGFMSFPEHLPCPSLSLPRVLIPCEFLAPPQESLSPHTLTPTGRDLCATPFPWSDSEIKEHPSVSPASPSPCPQLCHRLARPFYRFSCGGPGWGTPGRRQWPLPSPRSPGVRLRPEPCPRELPEPRDETLPVVEQLPDTCPRGRQEGLL